MRISIIIPCYKAASTLNLCLDKINAQTFTDWEVILIDDGSPDNTGEICDHYASKNPQIHVIHKKNEGVSSARNIGIKKATGDFITFIDADDSINNDYLQNLIKDSDADLILCGFKSSMGINYIPQPAFYNGESLNQYIQNIVDDPYLLYSPWCKLFRRNIINKYNILFDTNLRLGEDTMFCYTYLLYCNSIRIVASNSYFYNGKWGGNGKYKLSQQEVEHLNYIEIELLNQINNKFNCNIDLTYRGNHIDLLNNLYKDFTDYTLFEIYQQTHKTITLNDYLKDKKLNFIFWGIIELEALYKKKEYEKGKEFLRILHHFFSIKTSKVTSLSLKMSIIHFLVQRKLFNTANYFLRIINNLR